MDPQVAQLAETVVDLMLTAPDEKARRATLELVDTLAPPAPRRTPPSPHDLCEVFEGLAEALQTLIGAPRSALDSLVGDTVADSAILAACVKVLLKRAVELSLQPVTTPLSVLHLKACACAVMFCPDASEHTSLDATCGMPILNAIPDL